MSLSGFGLAASGCVGLGNQPDDGATETNTETNAPSSERDDEQTYFFSAAPAYEDDELDAVLSSDDAAVAAIEPLLDVLSEVVAKREVVRQRISQDDAEAFEALTADVEYYFAGNPPGYYIEHEDRTVSVTLGGG